MKKRFIRTTLSALVLTLAIGGGVTAYAQNGNRQFENPQYRNFQSCGGNGVGRQLDKRGYEFVEDLLKEEYKISEEDIQKAREEGKTIRDLLEERDIEFETFRDKLLEEKFKAIDEAVAQGTISKEDAEDFKEVMKERMENYCDGTGFGNGKGNGRGKGFGRGRGCRF